MLISRASIVVISFVAMLYTKSLALQWMMAAASVKILFTMMARVYVVEMRRTGNFKMLASRTLLGKVAGGVGGIAIAFWGFGAWAVIAQALIMGYCEPDPGSSPLYVRQWTFPYCGDQEARTTPVARGLASSLATLFLSPGYHRPGAIL